MPASPLISIQGRSSACTFGHGAVQKAKWLGGGPALSVIGWDMGSLHKEFPNKRHQYYLWSHQSAWGTIWLWLSHMLPPQVLWEGVVGSPQTYLGPEHQCVGWSPSSSLSGLPGLSSDSVCPGWTMGGL